MTLAAYYKTKKQLKESIGETLRYGETSVFGAEYDPNGTVTVIGPSEYERKWDAQVTSVNNKITKVT